jgi:hypothetical protein
VDSGHFLTLAPGAKREIKPGTRPERVKWYAVHAESTFWSGVRSPTAPVPHSEPQRPIHIATDQIYRYTNTIDTRQERSQFDVQHHPTVKMAPGMSLYSVNAIIILSTDDGARIFSKYYAPPHNAAGNCMDTPPDDLLAGSTC